MQVSTELALAVGGSVVAICAWLFRLEGRVNTHEEVHRQFRENQADMKEDITYIRDRIDKALNGYGK